MNLLKSICKKYHKKVVQVIWDTLFDMEGLQSDLYIYILAEGPGVAPGKKIEKINFFSLKHPPATHECPQTKFQPIRSSRFAGFKQDIYECLVLLYRYIFRCLKLKA